MTAAELSELLNITPRRNVKLHHNCLSNILQVISLFMFFLFRSDSNRLSLREGLNSKEQEMSDTMHKFELNSF